MNPMELTVAITGMNARPDNPGPGYAVARCLREMKNFHGKIVGLSYDALDPGLYARDVCDSSSLLPYPSAGDAALLERIRDIHTHAAIDVLIPCLDSELTGMVRIELQLRALGIKTFLPTEEQLRMRGKDRLAEVAELGGIDSPDSQPVTRAAFFYECHENGWSYPFVVKGLYYDARVVKNADEGAEAFRQISAEWGVPVLVQKLVRGDEINLTAVGDGSGAMLGAVMMKKMAVTAKGKAWAGVSIHDATLERASAAIVKGLRWRGPLEVEVMRDADGRYQLIEINPRFPAWIYLTSGVGRNLPEALLRLAMGEAPQDFPPAQTGVLFIRHAQEMIVPIAQFETIVTAGTLDLSASRKASVTS